MERQAHDVHMKLFSLLRIGSCALNGPNEELSAHSVNFAPDTSAAVKSVAVLYLKLFLMRNTLLINAACINAAWIVINMCTGV